MKKPNRMNTYKLDWNNGILVIVVSPNMRNDDVNKLMEKLKDKPKCIVSKHDLKIEYIPKNKGIQDANKKYLCFDKYDSCGCKNGDFCGSVSTIRNHEDCMYIDDEEYEEDDQ